MPIDRQHADAQLIQAIEAVSQVESTDVHAPAIREALQQLRNNMPPSEGPVTAAQADRFNAALAVFTSLPDPADMTLFRSLSTVQKRIPAVVTGMYESLATAASQQAAAEPPPTYDAPSSTSRFFSRGGSAAGARGEPGPAEEPTAAAAVDERGAPPAYATVVPAQPELTPEQAALHLQLFEFVVNGRVAEAEGIARAHPDLLLHQIPFVDPLSLYHHPFISPLQYAVKAKATEMWQMMQRVCLDGGDVGRGLWARAHEQVQRLQLFDIAPLMATYNNFLDAYNRWAQAGSRYAGDEYDALYVAWHAVGLEQGRLPMSYIKSYFGPDYPPRCLNYVTGGEFMWAGVMTGGLGVDFSLFLASRVGGPECVSLLPGLARAARVATLDRDSLIALDAAKTDELIQEFTERLRLADPNPRPELPPYTP